MRIFTLIDEKTLYESLKVTPSKLRKMREESTGPEFLKIGGFVRYDPQDAQDWWFRFRPVYHPEIKAEYPVEIAERIESIEVDESPFGHIYREQILAGFLQISAHTLQDWRKKGTGPAFFKIGEQIRYRHEDVLTWLEERKRG